MKGRAALGFLAGALLCASAVAHAFLGWPPLAAALRQAAVDEDPLGALAAGWIFGSVAMLVFGLTVLQAAATARGGRRPPAGSLGLIAAGYAAFGLAAFLIRGLNPHFLGFIVIGALVGAFAWPRP